MPLASLALEARLLFDGALGSGNRFQPLIGNWLTAFYGEAKCASGKPLLGVLDRSQLGPQIIDLPLVEFVLVETRAGVRHLVPFELIRARDPELGERLCDAVAFAAKKLPCSFGIHVLSGSVARRRQFRPGRGGYLRLPPDDRSEAATRKRTVASWRNYDSGVRTPALVWGLLIWVDMSRRWL
jgi:hypothetical protein